MWDAFLAKIYCFGFSSNAHLEKSISEPYYVYLYLHANAKKKKSDTVNGRMGYWLMLL